MGYMVTRDEGNPVWEFKAIVGAIRMVIDVVRELLALTEEFTSGDGSITLEVIVRRVE